MNYQRQKEPTRNLRKSSRSIPYRCTIQCRSNWGCSRIH